MGKSGETIAERYRLLEPLGSGGMGEVWSAEHLTLRAPVAIKLLKRELVATKEAERRFEREARAAAAIRSPHVVRITDHGLHGDAPFMVMELLEGETLAARIARKGTLSPRETLRVVTHLGRALTKAHEAGVIHRDVKPANVFITSGDDEEIVKLVDFGVVKVTSELDAVSATKSGSLVGTPLYMSPEQLRALPLDHRSDLWSLAIVTYECLCGSPPFPQHSLADLIVAVTQKDVPPPSLRAAVPAGLDEWFERAARRDPKERFASAREMVSALRPILERAASVPPSEAVPRAVADAPTVSTEGSPPQTLGASIMTASSGRERRRMSGVAAAAVVGTVAILGLGRWLLAANDAPRSPSPPVVAPSPPPPVAASASATSPEPARTSELAASTLAAPPPAPPRSRTRARSPEPTAAAPVARIVTTASAGPTPAPAAPSIADNPLAF